MKDTRGGLLVGTPEKGSRVQPVVEGVMDPDRARWLKRLWQLATHDWTTLWDIDNDLYRLQMRFARSGPVDVKAARRWMGTIQRLEGAIKRLAHERVPDNFGSPREEMAVYRGISDAWQTAALLSRIHEKFQYLHTSYSTLTAEVANLGQERMNLTMTIFSFLTFARVLADAMSAIDFNGVYVGSVFRLFLIGMGPLGATALSHLIGLFVHRRQLAR